jgi:hypothetical protein
MPKQHFNLNIEAGQLAALRAIEERSGVTVTRQIRRAVDAYLRQQRVLTKSETRKLRGAAL